MSHHISGPRAMAEPAADIADLFAFPSPEQPGRLVLGVYGSAYRARLNANLAFWDGLGGKTDWPAMIRRVGPLRTDGLVSFREEGRVVFCWLPHGLNGRLPDESVLALGSRAPCRREGGGRR